QDEQLGNASRIEIPGDGRVGRRAHGAEDEQNVLLLDELASLLHGLRRTEPVVQADQPELSAVDSALVVDLGEIGGHGLADGGIGRYRTAVGNGLADADLGVRDPRTIRLAGARLWRV